MPTAERLRTIAREPLVHFVAGALVLFAVERAVTSRPHRGASDARRIVVSDAFVRGLAARQRAMTGRAPTAAETEALVGDYVRDEALERGAREMGLDVGDPIVRRRLVQKMEFVVAGEVEVPSPDDAALERWRLEHADALRTPPTVSFAQVFFSRDRRGARAADDARAARPDVIARGDDAVAMGDPFVAGHRFAALTPRDVASTFGEGFARALETVTTNAWSGVVESPYGAHLVRVTARDPGRLPPLDEVRESVRQQWVDATRSARTREAIARLVAEYTVVRVPEDPRR